jgi:hypothetical protein
LIFIPLILINLTPFIPLSFSRRGGRSCREGAKPPLLFTLPFLLRSSSEGNIRGAFAPLKKNLSLSLRWGHRVFKRDEVLLLKLNSPLKNQINGEYKRGVSPS